MQNITVMYKKLLLLLIAKHRRRKYFKVHTTPNVNSQIYVCKSNTI